MLLDMLSKSDESAFTEIYNRFWQKLFAIAYNRFHESEVAEDIVHDVFASLWANRQKAEIACLENYLATATKYMVLAKIKKKERKRIYANSIHTAPVVELTVETSLHYKRVLELIKTEVDKLPQKCRLVFICSRNEGMSIKQIADEFNISPKTVENHLNKALNHLRVAIKTIVCFLVFLVPAWLL
jgi:RNA polymerase sigma-70 factor (ECF subfamily)